MSTDAINTALGNRGDLTADFCKKLLKPTLDDDAKSNDVGSLLACLVSVLSCLMLVHASIHADVLR